MSITVDCPACGHTLKAPDNAAGRKGKCPKCSGIVPIPDMPDILDDDEPAPSSSGFAPAGRSSHAPAHAPWSVPNVEAKARVPVPQDVIGMIVGKPATAWGYRSSFGRTTLAFTSSRLIETTRRPIEERDCELFLADVDSVEMTAKGNPTFLAFALTTVSLVGIHPLLLLVPLASVVLFFVLKHRFLIVRSQANVVVLGVIGKDGACRDFMNFLLETVERT